MRDGSALGVTLLSSDMGKLYVALAQAIERLRKLRLYLSPAGKGLGEQGSAAERMLRLPVTPSRPSPSAGGAEV